MEEYGWEAPGKFVPPSKYKDLDSPPPTTDLPRVSMDDMQMCNLKFYNLKKKLHSFQLKAIELIRVVAILNQFFRKCLSEDCWL